MEPVTRILATTSEISLKGGNRRWFERTLTDNVRNTLSDLPVASVTRPSWRVLITFEEPVPFAEAARRLATVFGIGAIRPVELAGHTIEDLLAHLGELEEGHHHGTQLQPEKCSDSHAATDDEELLQADQPDNLP